MCCGQHRIRTHLLIAMSCYVRKCYSNTKFNINTVNIPFSTSILFSLHNLHTTYIQMWLHIVMLCGCKMPIIVLGGGETMIFSISSSRVIKCVEDNIEL